MLKMLPAFLVLLSAAHIFRVQGANVEMKSYSNPGHHLVRNTTQVVNDIKTAADCVGQCLKYLNTSCRSMAYKDHGDKRCIISSEVVFKANSGVDVFSISEDYRLYSQDSCPEGWYKFNPSTRTCVGLHLVLSSWQYAKNYCESRGERLLTLDTVENTRWVVSAMQDYNTEWKQPWIGGYRTSGVWDWKGRITGNPGFSISDYWTDDPDDSFSCLTLWNSLQIPGNYQSNKLFDDFSCGALKHCFCETDALV